MELAILLCTSLAVAVTAFSHWTNRIKTLEMMSRDQL